MRTLLAFNVRRRRGVYLASVLLLTVMLVMLIGAAINLVAGSSGASNLTAEEALRAADSGVKYARARLAENYAWRGNGGGIIVNTSDLVVREDNGNVIGIMRESGGRFSQFRFRFNYQDDAVGNAEGLPNPASLTMDLTRVSVNNVLGGSPTPVFWADGPGASVTPTSTSQYDVPAGTACLIVEGRAGDGMRNLSPTDLQPPLNTGRSITSRIVEVYLRATAGPTADAAAMAAGDLTVDLGLAGLKTTVTNVQKAGVPRIRSKKAIQIKDGTTSQNYKSDQGETYSQTGTLAAVYDPLKTKTLTEAANANFYRLSWADVKKATSSDTHLPSGTYVLWDDGSLHRYDMKYSDYVTYIQTTPTDAGSLVSSLPSGMQLDVSDTSKPKLVISGNIYVDPVGQSTDELTFIPRKGAQEDLPGAAAAPAQPPTAYASALAAPTATGGAASFTAPGAAPYAAQWNVPLPAPLSAPITAGTGSWAMGTYWGIKLTDVGGGMGKLQIDSGYQPLTSPTITSNPGLALVFGFQQMAAAGNPQFQALYSALVGTPASDAMSELNLGSLTPTLGTDDLTVTFKPAKGESAILSADGNVRLGAKVTGTGGSITSGGMIRMVGAGSSLNASIKDGLNLYAKGDIVLSSLRQKAANDYEYKDFKMKGVIYSWGNFTAKIGYADPKVSKWGTFNVDGALVAYGGNPTGNPGDDGTGAMKITASAVNLTFDAAYLVQINNAPVPGPLIQTFYTLF